MTNGTRLRVAKKKAEKSGDVTVCCRCVTEIKRDEEDRQNLKKRLICWELVIFLGINIGRYIDIYISIVKQFNRFTNNCCKE